VALEHSHRRTIGWLVDGEFLAAVEHLNLADAAAVDFLPAMDDATGTRGLPRFTNLDDPVGLHHGSLCDHDGSHAGKHACDGPDPA
jgi:hypothetical protein